MTPGLGAAAAMLLRTSRVDREEQDAGSRPRGRQVAASRAGLGFTGLRASRARRSRTTTESRPGPGPVPRRPWGGALSPDLGAVGPKA